MKEHENILKIAEALEDECREIESGKEIDGNFFKKAIDFIRNYADKLHHAKEEDILFREFTKAAEEGCSHCNPVEQMLYEHDLGRNFVKEVEEGIKKDNKERVIEGARGYSHLIREHIFKEDNILYPMADDVFSEKTKKEILNKFKSIENKRKSDIKKYLGFVNSIQSGK